MLIIYKNKKVEGILSKEMYKILSIKKDSTITPPPPDTSVEQFEIYDTENIADAVKLNEIHKATKVFLSKTIDTQISAKILSCPNLDELVNLHSALKGE